MRAALLAIALVGCGAAQRPAPSSGVALSYEARVDAALSTMEVTLCPSDAPLPQALVPVHDETNEHVRSASLVRDGEVLATLPLSSRIDLSAAPAAACVRWEVDLASCTSPRGPSSCARVGRDVFAPTSVWLLAPDRRAIGAHYDLRFVLPHGVFVSPITEGASRDPSHVVMDDRNFTFVTYVALTHAPAHTIAVPGACMDVVEMDGALDASPEAQTHWLSVAAEASSRVTGQTPFDRITALVVPTRDVPGMPVLFGVAGRGMRPTVTLLASQHATEAQLVPDWTAIHELSHLLTAYVDGEDTWLSEGLATYYEEVLRARQGLLTETQAWTQLVRGFERGRAASTSGTLRDACTSMRAEHAYARVYWQGAALVLMADVAYRREGSSLDEAIARAWPHRAERSSASQLLEWLDGTANGTFATLAASSLDAEEFPDVTAVLTWLGVQITDTGTVSLDADAPGSSIRIALMNRGADPASNPTSCDAPGR